MTKNQSRFANFTFRTRDPRRDLQRPPLPAAPRARRPRRPTRRPPSGCAAGISAVQCASRPICPLAYLQSLLCSHQSTRVFAVVHNHQSTRVFAVVHGHQSTRVFAVVHGQQPRAYLYAGRPSGPGRSPKISRKH